jgi:hypothetical protein
MIPCILICFGWGRRAFHEGSADAPTWRDRCIAVSFVSGILGALIGVAADLLWLHGGGDPHGMGSAPGVWRQLTIMSWCTYPATLVFAILGKGRGRFFILAALAATCFAEFVVPILQMD